MLSNTLRGQNYFWYRIAGLGKKAIDKSSDLKLSFLTIKLFLELIKWLTESTIQFRVRVVKKKENGDLSLFLIAEMIRSRHRENLGTVI